MSVSIKSGGEGIQPTKECNELQKKNYSTWGGGCVALNTTMFFTDLNN